MKEGYLKEVYNNITKNGIVYKQKTKPILYHATDKEFLWNDKLTHLTSGGRSENNLVENPRLNLRCLKYPIIEPPKREIIGDSWVNNNTQYTDYKREFNCGEVTFRIINNITLVIWIPEKIVDRCYIRNISTKVHSDIQLYADWFQKEFCCKLGSPSPYQDLHMAFKENDPMLCNLVDKYGLLKIIDIDNRVVGWWDKSKKYVEFETHDERIAEARAFYPYKIVFFEDKISELEASIEKLPDLIADKICNHYNDFNNNQKNINMDRFEDVT